MNLEDVVLELMNSNKEGVYWDFKQKDMVITFYSHKKIVEPLDI